MNNELNNKNFELDDDMLDEVAGGTADTTAEEANFEFAIGERVKLAPKPGLKYCSNCGSLLNGKEGIVLYSESRGCNYYRIDLPCCINGMFYASESELKKI